MATDNLERISYMLDFIALPFSEEALSGKCGCGQAKNKGSSDEVGENGNTVGDIGNIIGENGNKNGNRKPMYTSKRKVVERELLETLKSKAETLEAALDEMSEENMSKIMSHFDVSKIDTHLSALKAFENKEKPPTLAEIKKWDKEVTKDTLWK